MHVEGISIRLEAMRFYAYHGVLDQERQVGNHFTLECCVQLSSCPACQSDALEDTLSYADLYTVLAEEMQQPSRLLEHVVGRMSKRLFASFPEIAALELKLSKDNPPFPGQLAAASVSIKARR